MSTELGKCLGCIFYICWEQSLGLRKVVDLTFPVDRLAAEPDGIANPRDKPYSLYWSLRRVYCHFLPFSNLGPGCNSSELDWLGPETHPMIRYRVLSSHGEDSLPAEQGEERYERI